MIKLFSFFLFFAPLVCSMDVPRGRERHRSNEGVVSQNTFDGLIRKTRILFDTTGTSHPFRRRVAGTLLALRHQRDYKEILNDEISVSVFLEIYVDFLVTYKLQEYASLNHIDAINIDLLSRGQKQELMRLIISKI